MSADVPGSPAIRASDEERERAATALRAHFGAGRLTDDEFDERTDAVYAARTVGELNDLLADLPALPPPKLPGRLDPGREAAKRGVLARAGWLAIACLAAVAIWAATGADGGFWPKWIILVAAIRIAFVSWELLGPGSEDRRRLGRGGTPPAHLRDERPGRHGGGRRAHRGPAHRRHRGR